MRAIVQIANGVQCWIDHVAATIVAIIDNFVSPRMVRLVEESPGNFLMDLAGHEGSSERPGHVQIIDGRITGSTPPRLATLLKGSRVELVLQPARFLFRTLELPGRASEFLEGIIRSQIDRLTPWIANDAAFGWSTPDDLANGRIVVTVVATARALISPVVNALAEIGANSIVIATPLNDPRSGAATIRVLEQRVRAAADVPKVRRVLLAILAISGLSVLAALTAGIVLGDDLQIRYDDVARRTAQARVSIRAGHNAASSSAISKLEQRKREVPSAVIVVEALSRILPDHTYVTELRIEGNKLQIVGLTQDAPSLIRLIEASSNFTRATFFAPTTHSASESGERFHIEARIEPIYTPHT